MGFKKRIPTKRIAVFCPHVEIMEVAKSMGQRWENILREAYSFDAINFIYSVLKHEFRRLTPPCANMPSPQPMHPSLKGLCTPINEW
jgi:hypothetical protein